MELNHVKEGANVIITIKGRLDAASSPKAGSAIENIMQTDCNRVLFDFSDLEYLSSGGLRVILGVAKALKHREGQLVLCALNPFVKEIFVVSGFESMIPIADTVASGIRQLDAN
jgi:anti-anti-sigma factor